eukprot:Opistho-2@7796
MPSVAKVAQDAAWVAVGAASAVVVAALAQRAKEALLRSLGIENEDHMTEEDARGRLGGSISLESLATLAQAEAVSLRKSSTHVLLDKAMRPSHVAGLIAACDCSGLSLDADSEDENSGFSDLLPRLKAASAIAMLAKVPEYQERLIAAGALGALMQCLCVAASRQANAAGLRVVRPTSVGDAKQGASGDDFFGDLPAEWEVRFASTGMPYYVDHRLKTTTWKKPGTHADPMESQSGEQQQQQTSPPAYVSAGGALP